MKRMPPEERFRKPVEVAARVIGWLVGLGLTSTGIAGAAYCLLHWTSFLFGFRYFAGMAEWRVIFVFSLLLIFVGVLTLRSAWKMRIEEKRRNQS